jgi:hypothetical protein
MTGQDQQHLMQTAPGLPRIISLALIRR